MHEAPIVTTCSNVECVIYLLKEMCFHFVLTKMSFDPIESFFGWLMKSTGNNDQSDVRAVLSGIEKTLKTGIATAPSTSNVKAAGNSVSTITMQQETCPMESAAGQFQSKATKCSGSSSAEIKQCSPHLKW